MSEGLEGEGALKPIAVARCLMALEKIVTKFQPKHKRFRAVGTAALRMASNEEVFLAPAAEILGTEVEIISGQEEAVLVGQSAAFGTPLDGHPITSVDVGGQSTEICAVDGDSLTPSSLPFGVVSLTTRFIESDPPAKSELDAIREETFRILRTKWSGDVCGEVVGVAGTATTLGRLAQGSKEYRREDIHGLRMSRTELSEWRMRISGLTAAERISKLGVPAMRADVFPAGLVVLECLLDHLGRDGFVISTNGLRYGVAMKLLEA